MNSKKKITALLLTCVTGFGLTLAGLGTLKDTEAASREMNSGFCHAATDDVGTTLQNKGTLTNTSTSARAVYCPVMSDSAQDPGGATGVAVDGLEGTDGSTSRACSCEVDPIACTCSTQSNWVNSHGRVISSLNVSVWPLNRATEYRYVLHSLTANSSLAGMIIF
jgi:hypothetical protein